MLVDVRDKSAPNMCYATDFASAYTWMVNVPTTENVPPSQHIDV